MSPTVIVIVVTSMVLILVALALSHFADQMTHDMDYPEAQNQPTPEENDSHTLGMGLALSNWLSKS